MSHEKWAPLPDTAVLNPGGLAVVSTHAPFKNCFFVCKYPVGVMDTRLALKNQVLWGSVPWVRVLKVKVLHMWSKPFPCQGETGSWVVLSWLYGAVFVWSLWRECASTFPTNLNVGTLSLTRHAGVTKLVSGFLLEGISLCVAVHLVSLWEREVRGKTSLLCHHLLPTSSIYFFLCTFLVASQNFWNFVAFILIQFKIFSKFPCNFSWPLDYLEVTREIN